MAFDITKLGEWFIPGYFNDKTNPAKSPGDTVGPKAGTYKITAEELRKGLTTIREGAGLDLTTAPPGNITLPKSHEIFTLSADVAATANINDDWKIGGAGGTKYSTTGPLRYGQAVALLDTGALMPLEHGSTAHVLGSIDVTKAARGGPFRRGDIINSTTAGTGGAGWPGLTGNPVEVGAYIHDGGRFIPLSAASSGINLLHDSGAYETDVTKAASGAVATALTTDQTGDLIKASADGAVDASFSANPSRKVFAGELLINDGTNYQPLPYLPFDISKLPTLTP